MIFRLRRLSLLICKGFCRSLGVRLWTPTHLIRSPRICLEPDSRFRHNALTVKAFRRMP